ncbi:MAG: hypothetical protein ACRD9Y_27350 [Blastocatellia bacterium]
MTKHTSVVTEPERGALAELEKDYIAEAEEQLERKFDEFVAKPHPHDAHPQSEDALQMLIVVADHFDIGNLSLIVAALDWKK